MNKLNEGIYFVSNNHTRIENGNKVDVDVRGVLRGVKILKEQSDILLYDVSIHILDDGISNWGNKIQMASKPMQIVNETSDKVLLRGVGFDQFGNSFSDYGIEITYDHKNAVDITLKLFDRNIDIIYHKAAKILSDDQNNILIADRLLNMLIQNHEDGNSLVRESDLKHKLKEVEKIEPTTEKITEAVNFLNIHCDKKIISEGRIHVGGILSSKYETCYVSKAAKTFLYELIGLLK